MCGAGFGRRGGPRRNGFRLGRRRGRRFGSLLRVRPATEGQQHQHSRACCKSEACTPRGPPYLGGFSGRHREVSLAPQSFCHFFRQAGECCWIRLFFDHVVRRARMMSCRQEQCSSIQHTLSKTDQSSNAPRRVDQMGKCPYVNSYSDRPLPPLFPSPEKRIIKGRSFQSKL